MTWLNEWKDSKGYRKAISRQLDESEPLDWKTQIQLGMAAGSDQWMQQIKELLSGKGRESGAREEKSLKFAGRKEKLAKVLSQEKDPRNIIWIRVSLLGERKTDLARELGYGSGMAIFQIVKRVNERAKTNTELKTKMKTWKSLCVID